MTEEEKKLSGSVKGSSSPKSRKISGEEHLGGIEGKDEENAKFKLSVSNEGAMTDARALPETFQVFTDKTWKNSDHCEICGKQVGAGKRHHCRRCGRNVCGDCSTNNRQLSIQDKQFYRVCDYCDKKLEYFQVEMELKKILQYKIGVINEYKEKIKELNNRKADKNRKAALMETRFKEIEANFKAAEETKRAKSITESARVKKMRENVTGLEANLKSNREMLQQRETTLKDTERKHGELIMEIEAAKRDLATQQENYKRLEQQISAQKDKLAKIQNPQI